MPTATWDGADLYFERDGPASDATVAFVNPAGYGAWLWGWHQPALAGPWETLVWDLPGTGESDLPEGGLGVDDLADALEAVLAAHGTRRVHLVGAALGGMVALRYARRYGRARSLTLFAPAADGQAVTRSALSALGLRPAEGDRAACRESLAGAFTPGYRERASDQVAAICDWRLAEDATGAALARQEAAMCEFRAGPLHEVALPALVCHGLDDPVVPSDAGREVAEGLPRGQFEAVEGRHLAFVEHARAVTDRVATFLEDVAAD